MSTGEPAADPPTRRPADLIGVAIGSIWTGAAAGAAVVTLGLLIFREQLNESLPLVLFAGILAAALTGWLKSQPLAAQTWRRGVTAALAVFAGMLLAFLSAPADRAGGTFGLSLYALALTALAILGARYTRARSQP